MAVKMPRRKTMPDEAVLEAALQLLHDRGPEALTFANLAQASGLAAATLVQRFGSKARLKQAALLHAWDHLDEKTARLGEQTPSTPEGAVALLVGLSGDYGGIEAYAEGLLVLREDLRDPQLRARGAQWRDTLAGILDRCLAEHIDGRQGLGLLMASQWQGALVWWGFEPDRPVTEHVGRELEQFVAQLVRKGAGA